MLYKWLIRVLLQSCFQLSFFFVFRNRLIITTPAKYRVVCFNRSASIFNIALPLLFQYAALTLATRGGKLTCFYIAVKQKIVKNQIIGFLISNSKATGTAFRESPGYSVRWHSGICFLFSFWRRRGVAKSNFHIVPPMTCAFFAHIFFCYFFYFIYL